MTDLQLGCDVARHRTLEIRGIPLHMLESGPPGAPGLCFLHGGAAHAHWFDRVTPAFADRFHVVALDQRGHGESGWARPPAYGTEDFVVDLRALVDALGWKRFVLAGHSMGGHNAMAFTAWHPERVRALVVIDARPAIPAERLEVMHRRGARAPRRHATVQEAVASFRLLPRETEADPALLAHIARAGIVERDGRWVARFDPDTNRLRRPTDGWRLLDRISAPTLVVRAERSPVLPPDMVERMLGLIPHAAFVEIPGAYHHLVLDAPEAFTAAVDGFLKTLP
jgi:pimeloyl-ACP methyl ester carboxylesterase